MLQGDRQTDFRKHCVLEFMRVASVHFKDGSVTIEMTKKNKKPGIQLNAEEVRELEMILDRLSVQDPEGESLEVYLESLHTALAGREQLIGALLQKLSRNPSEVGFRAFLSFENQLDGKGLRRIVKRARYRFEQRGYSQGEEESGAEPNVVLVHKESKQPVAHLVPADDVIWLVTALFPGEGTVPLGISAYAEKRFRSVSVKITESSHRSYREYLRKLSEYVTHRAFEVPIWHAARVYFDMLRFHGEEPVSQEADQLKRLFQPFYDADQQPYAYQLLPVLENPADWPADLQIEPLLEKLVQAELHFSKEELTPYMDKIYEVEHSVLVVRPEIQHERGLSIMKKAVAELCSGEKRLLYQRVFEELALRLHLTGEETLARAAWSVAQHLQSAAAVEDNAVMAALVAVSMKRHWPEVFAQPAEQERQAVPFNQTESGIILPS